MCYPSSSVISSLSSSFQWREDETYKDLNTDPLRTALVVESWLAVGAKRQRPGEDHGRRNQAENVGRRYLFEKRARLLHVESRLRVAAARWVKTAQQRRRMTVSAGAACFGRTL